MKLNRDVIGLIAQYAGEKDIINLLKPYMTLEMFNSFHLIKNEKKYKKLIYGEVQSGKTAKIIEELRMANSVSFPSILVIQNSLLVLKQYVNRLTEAGIDFQVLDSKTKKIEKPVVVLMNNVYRNKKYVSLSDKPENYRVVLDESDLTIKNLTIENNIVENSYSEVHVTATPFISKYKNYFDKIEKINKTSEYFGIDKVDVKVVPCEVKNKIDVYDYKYVVNDFIKTPTGILFINHLRCIDKMVSCANIISNMFTTIPVIVMTSEKMVFINGQMKSHYMNNVSKLLDKYENHKHIIIIANRLANRGLSYTNSTYTRHLTHQLSYINCKSKNIIKSKITHFLQRCRMFGKYTDEPRLTMYLSSNCVEKFEKYREYVSNIEKQESTLMKSKSEINIEMLKSNLI